MNERPSQGRTSKGKEKVINVILNEELTFLQLKG